MRVVELLPREHKDGVITLAATVDGGTPVWIRVSADHADWLTDNADPLVVVLLPYLMQRGGPVRIAGPVCPTLLRNLEEYIAISTVWHPDLYRPVHLEADEERAPPGATNAGLVAFSGGVDCCFSAWRHTQGAVRRRRVDLRAGMFVSGIDMARGPACIEARDYNREILAGFGLDLFAVETNALELPVDTYHASGAAVAGCLLLFQKHFGKALIASGRSYRSIVPSPSSPVTDRLLGTGAMEIVHDGAEAQRPEKVGCIGAVPAVRRYLRVCGEGDDLPRNCGRCIKCLRTILNFRVMGHGRPACFPEELTLARLTSTKIKHPRHVNGFQEVLRLAAERGIEEPWVAAVRKVIRRYVRRARHHRLKLAWRRLRGRA